MQRINKLSTQLTAGHGNLVSPLNQRTSDDVVIVAAYRTPLTRARKGLLKDTAPEVMLSQVLKGLIDRTKVDPAKVEDMVVGNCLQPAAGAIIARAAQLMAGFPVESSVAAVNRQCSSGIEACSIIAAKIKSGIINVGIGAGVESMTNFEMTNMAPADKLSDDLFENEVARNCLLPMGLTAEVRIEFYSLFKRLELKLSNN